jgi:hypothetical protein
MLRSLKEQLSLKELVCTRLETKFNTYTSYHVSVIENEFPLISNTGLRPTECLIAPFYGTLAPDQMYSSSTPTTEDTALLSISNRESGGRTHPSK